MTQAFYHRKAKYVRPRLHPEMGIIPIAARVAVRLTERVWRDVQYCESPSHECARIAARNLPLDYPGFVRFALHSLSVYLFLGWKSSAWLSEVLEASHFANNFRRCFFFAYKENRSPYPRVTNRGVQTSSGGKASKRKGHSSNA